VSWVPHHGRSADLAAQVGAVPLFVAAAKDRHVLLRYTAAGVHTTTALFRRRPRAVLVMLPPIPLLVVARAWTWLTGAVLVADLHSGVFNDTHWSWARRPTLLLLRGATALVTVREYAESCGRSKVDSLVLHDSLQAAHPRVPADGTDASVLVPLSFAPDEPVEAILTAAEALPAVTWILTGRAPLALAAAAPPNVRLVGYVSNAEYQELLRRSSLVVALTTREHTMQRAAYEAALLAKPLVTSDTEALRDFFGAAALYARPDGVSIAGQVRAALEQGHELQERMTELIARRVDEQQDALAALQRILLAT